MGHRGPAVTFKLLVREHGQRTFGLRLVAAQLLPNSSPQSERMRLDQNGNFGIGNTAPAKLLHVGSASVGTGLAVANFQNVDGTCTITPAASGSGIACSSDERLKENFQDVQGSFALDHISKLQAVTYNFKTASTQNRRTGYKAQEITLAKNKSAARII